MTESPRARPGLGGFLPSQTALASPAPSTASSRIAALLPRPRSKPLVPGSKKEDYARDYVARKLLHISRRYVKKFGIPDPADEVTGYGSMEEVYRDLEEVVDVLWFSGTPSLQVPYLLNVALAFNTYLPSFPPTPRPTFAFLRKLDHCFASLLVGYDVKTKDVLPGFTSTVDGSVKSRFSRTDMVRCKSLADETRMLVAMVMSGEADVDHDEDDDITRLPAGATAEDQGESVDGANSASHNFQDTDSVKSEEFEDVANDFDFGRADEETTTPLKRKSEEMVEDVSMTDQTTNPKRVKIEEEEEVNASMDLSAIATADVGVHSANPSKNVDEAKFHWALEDDDSNDEDDPRDITPIDRKTHSLLPQPSVSNTVEGSGGDMEDKEVAEGGEEFGEGEGDDAENQVNDEAEDEDEDEYEDEDGDEEFKMNVGQVYEKTLVQLGESLGQSIIGD